MNRERHSQRHGRFRGVSPLRVTGWLALMGFVLFISFRIFTPPVKTVQAVIAPDGSRVARLQYVYYYSDPGYKISVRDVQPEGFRLLNPWHTLYYLPEYTNAPAARRDERLRWATGSNRLYFEINGVPVWGYDFTDQSSRLRSP